MINYVKSTFLQIYTVKHQAQVSVKELRSAASLEVKPITIHGEKMQP